MPRRGGEYSEKYSALRPSTVVLGDPPKDGGGAAQPVHHGTLSVADIAGAQPSSVIRARKIEVQEPPDPGMQPQRFTRERRQSRDLQLTVADIPGATPGGHSSWMRPRAHPLNPLEPQYQWSFDSKEQPAPPPKFIRDALSVSDIAGAQAGSQPMRPCRGGLPSTMDAADIEGARPGWRPHILFGGQPRDPLRVSDICSSSERSPRHAAKESTSRSPARQPGSSPEVPEYGVPCSVEWQKQRLGAKVKQGGEAWQARQAADAAIAAAAATASMQSTLAGTSGSEGRASNQAVGSAAAGLAGMMRSLKAFDREKSGTVQAGQFAAALQHSGLGLSQGEVQQLVSSMRDCHDNIDYRTFASKMWGKMQAAAAPPAGPAGSSGGGGGFTPHFIAARQRRLQTNVALAMGQQPAATAQEAAEVAQLPGVLPWRPAKTYSFWGHDPRVLQAAAEMRAGDRAAKERQLGRQPGTAQQVTAGASTSLPSTAPRSSVGAQQWQQAAASPPAPAAPGRQLQAATETSSRVGSREACSLQAGGPAGRGSPICSPGAAAAVSYARPALARECGGTLLAAERAAKAAVDEESAMLRGLE